MLTNDFSKVTLAKITFDWCLRNLQSCIRHNSLEDALKWAALSAYISTYYGFAHLASPALETALHRIAQSIPSPIRDHRPDHPAPKHWLHVFSEVYEVGGHTAAARRWIELDATDSRHSVILLSQRFPTPVSLAETIKSKGGTILRLDANLSLVERVSRLREEAYAKADVIVLHVHPDDVTATVAFGIDGGPPVLFFNHADHLSWVGGSVADYVINIRPSGREWSEKFRGIDRNLTLPLPLPEFSAQEGSREVSSAQRAAARQALQLPETATVLLTIGSAYKYTPLAELDFLKAAEEILHACPHAYLIAVGPEETEAWMKVRRATGNRLRAVGMQSDLSPFHAVADIYLEGFPFGSLTALLEVGMRGIPCVRSPQPCLPPFCSDGDALEIIEQPKDVSAYIREAIALFNSQAQREEWGGKLATRIKSYHCGDDWQQQLKKIQETPLGEHQVYQLSDAEPLPEYDYDYSRNFLSVARKLIRFTQGDDVWHETFIAARDNNLSPQARVDLRLWFELQKITNTECLTEIAATLYANNSKQSYLFLLAAFRCRPNKETLTQFIYSLFGISHSNFVKWNIALGGYKHKLKSFLRSYGT